MKQLPEALLKELESVEGFDKASFIEAHQHEAATSIRLNPNKKAHLTFTDINSVLWCKNGIYLAKRPVFTLDPHFHAGAYYVQEASSMFLEHVMHCLFPEPKELRILDLCAAPGGKSTLLASLIDENSLLISNEVIRTRATILEENCVRWGYTNNWVTSNDPKDFNKLEGYFDCIVIDAPCSGSGLFRKDEYALTNWSEDNVNLCAARQKRIIADVWNCLKENGIIIYATCSYSPQEDEEILDWTANELSCESISIPLQKEWNITTTYSPNKKIEGYRFFPNKLQGEGFFISAIRKKEVSAITKYPKTKLASADKLASQATTLLKENDWFFIEGKEDIIAINRNHAADYYLLTQHLYFRKAGLRLGTPKNNDWIPHHDLALSIHKNKHIKTIEVSKENALRFLKKEELQDISLDKGWYLVNYDGLSLGWIKSLGNRINNYLPKNWRIRMELPTENWA